MSFIFLEMDFGLQDVIFARQIIFFCIVLFKSTSVLIAAAAKAIIVEGENETIKMSRNKKKISKRLQKRIKSWIQSWIKFDVFFVAKYIINHNSFVNNFSNFLAFNWVL